MKYHIRLFSDVSVDVELLPSGNIKISSYPKMLENYITWEKKNNRFILSLFGGYFAIINPICNDPIVLRGNLTAVEIRSQFEKIRQKQKNKKEVYGNNVLSLQVSTQDNPAIKNETDLHTHFLEILTGKEFMEVLENFVSEIYVVNSPTFSLPARGEKGIPVSIEKIKYDGNWDLLCEKLSIGLNGQVPFSELHEIAYRRSCIVNEAIEQMCIKDGLEHVDKETIAKYRVKIYKEILRKVIKVYHRQDVTYAEMSYSTRSTIIDLVEFLGEKKVVEELEDLKLGFLFSVSRNVTRSGLSAKKEKDNKKKLKNQLEDFKYLIEHDYVVGFDLMGEEFGLTVADISDLNDPKTFISIMKNVLEILNGHTDKVLRIHAGENYESRYNPLYSLQVIEKLIDTYGYSIPQIRIGHGLYLPEEAIDLEEYARLLHELGVVVEINATSNFTLTNATDLYQIPYEWYQKHEIPMVLGTDGPGMYLTDTKQERYIARVREDPNKKRKPKTVQEEPAKDKHIVSDYEILELYNSNQEEAIIKAEKKYSTIISALDFYLKFNNDDRLLELRDNKNEKKEETIKEVFEKIKKITNKDNEGIIEAELLDTISKLKLDIYKKSNLGISYESYDDYLSSVPFNDDDLKIQQARSFYFLHNPILGEKEQVLHSVEVIKNYLFDMQSNEVKYNSSELNVFYNTIKRIKELVKDDKLAKAKLLLVALQMFFGLRVDFLTTLKRILIINIPLARILTDNYQYDSDLYLDYDKPYEDEPDYETDEKKGGPRI